MGSGIIPALHLAIFKFQVHVIVSFTFVDEAFAPCPTSNLVFLRGRYRIEGYRATLSPDPSIGLAALQ